MKDVILGAICASMIGCASMSPVDLDRKSDRPNFVPSPPELSAKPVAPELDASPSHTFLRTTSYVLAASAVESGKPKITVYDESSSARLEQQLNARALEDVSVQEAVALDGPPFEITSSHAFVELSNTVTELQPHGTVLVEELDNGEMSVHVKLQNSALLRSIDDDRGRPGIQRLFSRKKEPEVQFEHQELREAVVVCDGQRLLIGPFMESVSPEVDARVPYRDRPTATGRQRYLLTEVIRH